MSSREMAEAGVLGLDDNLLPAESDSVWELDLTASACEMKTSAHYNKMIPEVHTLDEMIVEETLKIHMFRQKEMPDKELPRSKILDSNRLSVRKEREAFRLQLEKEKQEVAILEKSLENECKVKERSKVIRCSIMAKTRAEEKDDNVKDLPGSSNGSHETALVYSDSDVLHKMERLEVTDPHILIENASNHLIQLPASQADHLKCKTSLIRRHASGLKPVEPLECVFSENTVKPEASLTPELRPDGGAFDPGGNCHVTPLPNPRKLLVALDKPPEDETPCSTEIQIPPLSSITDELVRETTVHKLTELPESANIKHGVIHTANVKEHQNDIKQMPLEEYQIPSDQFSERNIKDEDDTLVVFKPLGEGDLQLSEEMNTLSPVSRCLLHEPPFELQLSRGDQDADASGCLQPSDWMKVSGCESTDGDINFRKVMCLFSKCCDCWSVLNRDKGV